MSSEASRIVVSRDFPTALYQLELKLLDGSKLSLGDYQDHAILIVNTASKCGFTPQYKGLEELHRKFGDHGLLVLGCPCNQFGEQEPGEAEEIQEFCELTYQVQFPMTEKLIVNGEGTHPLYALITKEAKGLFNSAKIKWNFTKFLISPKASSIERFSPLTSPQKLEVKIRQMISI